MTTRHRFPLFPCLALTGVTFITMAAVRVQPTAQASCVAAFRVNLDSLSQRHLASTRLTAYQERARARLDSLAQARCLTAPTAPTPPLPPIPLPDSLASIQTTLTRQPRPEGGETGLYCVDVTTRSGLTQRITCFAFNAAPDTGRSP